MVKRMTDDEVVARALIDAISWNESLLEAMGEDDPHSARVRHRLERMREVRAEHYGERPDPLADAKMVSVDQIFPKG
jgi:hypothetical protein